MKNQNLSLDDQEDEFSESFIDLRKRIDSLVKSIPAGTTGEDYRAACSVITGTLNGRSLNETVKYYSLDQLSAGYWWKHFNFGETPTKERRKRGSKTASLESFIKNNFNKTFSSTDILKECNITAPTFYNFLNKNRGFFKKVGRGKYLIVDMDSERNKEKNVR